MSYNYLFYLKVVFKQTRLTQDRSESTNGNFFSVGRDNNSQGWLTDLPKLYMATFLRNINKALSLKDFDNMGRRI